MSEGSSPEPQFEDQFSFSVRERGLKLSSSRDSYSLDLLGFNGTVPMLAPTKSIPVVKLERLDPVNVNSSSSETDCNSLNEAQLTGEIPSPQDPARTPTSSALQGKRVIIRTNSMSGKKSLIFMQKTGGNVEIPAKLSTFSKTMEIKQEVPLQVAEQVHLSNVAHVVFPQANKHKPPILKRPGKVVFKSAKDVCDSINSDIRNIHVDVKVEEKDIFAEDEARILPFDHDYYNLASRGAEFCPEDGPPPLVKISAPRPVSRAVDEVIEIPDDDGEASSPNMSVVPCRTEIREIVPVKLVKHLPGDRRNQFSEANFDRFQAQKLQEVQMKQIPRSEEKQVSVVGKHMGVVKIETKTNAAHQKAIDNHLKTSSTTTNYEIVNTNLIKKGKDLSENKNHYIVMIANKETMDQMKVKEPTKIYKPVTVMNPKVTPPSFKIPFRQKLTDHKQVQTANTCATRTVETNTDDFLLDELIERKMRERALHNKVSKTTNTEELPTPRQNLDERIAITPSPLLLGCDPTDILELLESGPNPHIVGDNVDFGSGPTMGQVYPSFAGKSMSNTPTNGKVMDNCVSITDISYSSRGSACNGWSGTEAVMTPTNGWMAGLKGSNGGRPRVEPWKLQLFLDLKHCDQFDASGNMPLHNAVIQNNITLVKRQCLALRTRQIDINTLNHSTYTALQLALLHDASVHIVQLLLQHGADTSVLDPDGNNVLHICVTNSSESVTKLLLSSTVCADINGTNFEGYTPLIMCALYQKYVQADDLLSTGADPNITDKKSGRTPLFHAVETNDVEMVKLLLNHRAQPKVKNFFGTSPHDAMFELDTINPQIRSLILNKDEGSNSKPNVTDMKGRRKRKVDDDKTYTVRPYGAKNARTKVSRS